MTVFEYIIDTLPRKFEAIMDKENQNSVFLAFKKYGFKSYGISIVKKEGYFTVMRSFTSNPKKVITKYTTTDNKHELLGLLVELTK